MNQNKSLKTLYYKDYLTPIENWQTPTLDLHKNLNFLLVKDISKVNVLKFVHQQRSGNLPEAFDDYFSEVKQHHNVNTRQKHNLQVGRESVLGKKKMKHRGATLWNEIDKNTRNIETKKCFALNIKSLCIESY